uniref:hypothetical protein n=1 Tax=Chordicoccus furentiruminis TaxID=2709410 RepID=UPI002ED12B73
MHGDELKYITEAYETNWMSTVGANINSAEAEIAAKVGCKYALREKAKYDVYLGAVPLDGKNRKTSVYLILKKGNG